MTILLYDSLKSLPRGMGNHIFVFTGYASNKAEETTGIVTEVTCRYSVGDQFVIFKRNADDTSQRFEDALGWAVEHAKVYGLDSIYAVFELNRPIDNRFLEKMARDGILDRREKPIRPCDERQPRLVPGSSLPRQDNSSIAIRRRLVFRNRNSAIKSDRPGVQTN